MCPTEAPTPETEASAEPAAGATADAAAKCCGKSCCSRKGCGGNGKCCMCCGTGLSYTGASLLTAAGLYSLYFWMTILWPSDASRLEGIGKSFSGYSIFFYNAGHYLGLNWVAFPLLLIGVWAVGKKCCYRCAPRLLFIYGLLLTLIALAGLLSTGVDMAMLPAPHLP